MGHILGGELVINRFKMFLSVPIAVLLALSIATVAYAQTTGYVAVQGGKNYEYIIDELADSYDYYLMDQNDQHATLIKHFLAGRAIAEIDSEKGYLDFEALCDAYDAGTLDAYKAGSPVTLPPGTKVIKVEAGTGGQLEFGDETSISPPEEEAFMVIDIW
ncbi:MAG: hypothetical protein BWY65_02036 [Firmicutes bacterium ADurb.Bin373]|nr:hypothetical protein [Bacillota bacterium]OQA06974.1 MAG: hypothetical protein BWY65_02036 [Firmicutes bacterium ADurb.Bin373]